MLDSNCADACRNTTSSEKTECCRRRKRREQSEKDERTVREALRFFFSPEGNVFRSFITEEAVNFVDASGQEASEELLKTLGLANLLPMSSFFRAMSPTLSSEDK
jgi:aarF domain-containing kinase